MEQEEIIIGECFKSTEVDKPLYFEPYSCLSDKKAYISDLISGGF